jgi:RimJ/RimL family protein N-acetyltransferase
MIIDRNIEGELAILTPFKEHDVSDAYLGWLSNQKINKYLEVRFVNFSEAIAKDYVKNCNGSTDRYFLRILSKEGVFIGTCTIFLNNQHKTAEIGLMLGNQSFHNKGIGSEVVALLTRFCCADLNVRKVTAGIYASNTGSLRAFQKNGFVVEARLTMEVLLDETPEDVYRLAYFCERSKNGLRLFHDKKR